MSSCHDGVNVAPHTSVQRYTHVNLCGGQAHSAKTPRRVARSSCSTAAATLHHAVAASTTWPHAMLKQRAAGVGITANIHGCMARAVTAEGAGQQCLKQQMRCLRAQAQPTRCSMHSYQLLAVCYSWWHSLLHAASEMSNTAALVFAGSCRQTTCRTASSSWPHTTTNMPTVRVIGSPKRLEV